MMLGKNIKRARNTWIGSNRSTSSSTTFFPRIQSFIYAQTSTLSLGSVKAFFGAEEFGNVFAGVTNCSKAW